MSKMLDENIIKIKKSIDQDNSLINEVKEVVDKVKNGYIQNTVKTQTQNLGLEELKTIFNEMLEDISFKVSENLNKLEDVIVSYQNLDFRPRISNTNGKTSNGLNSLANIIIEMLVTNKLNGIRLLNSSDILLNNVTILNNNLNQSAALEETAAIIEEITGNVRNSTKNIQ